MENDLNFKKQAMNPYHTGSQSYTAYEKGFIEGYKSSPTGDRDCEELKKEVERLNKEPDWVYVLKLETEIEKLTKKLAEQSKGYFRYNND